MKYTEQFKLSVIQHYLDGSAGYKTVAKHYGIAGPVVRRWVVWYRLHGAEGVTQKRGRYSAEFKLSVLRYMWDNRLSQTQVAAHFNVRSTTRISEWERWYLSDESLEQRSPAMHEKMKVPPEKTPPTQAPEEPRTRDELLAELNYLRMENAYLKKLKALVDTKSATAKKRK
jgi:transposase